MKNQRETLINLIIESVDGCARYWAEIIADHLLENGVIVPMEQDAPPRNATKAELWSWFWRKVGEATDENL